ncbi:MAG: CPBP family intramembrane metalloprotease [Phycisphaerales bacterium]|nr:MAG: CPBP family intramembrane metalloprotease [Phycisphaerales bacterium]
MSFQHRVRTVYVKELVDILRDRRTLIAMIVVPIVLYPLLMIGSLQAIAIQGEHLKSQQVLVGVLNDEAVADLARLVTEDAQYVAALAPEMKDDEGGDVEPGLGESLRARKYASVEDLRAAVQDRSIQLGLVFDGPVSTDPHVSNRIQPYYDKEDPPSVYAYMRFKAMIERANERIRRLRLEERNLPPTLTRPFVLAPTDLSSPPSVLGQILPLVLVLMTITGAIYPAIDLTAGERERGTLETLMVCPVPIIDLISGKFLVVTTIAILGAALNLASVCVTVYFGGLNAVVAGGGGLPVGQLLLILLCLIPFAVLMSAIMLAVCSYARTFKEAQNYVTPVILAVLIPGGIAAMPATRLEGTMLVVPVGNMVLLARELLLGAHVSWVALATVLLSTTIYAAAAVAVAAKVFGKESVVFADSASLRSTFDRRLIRPAPRPSFTMAFLLVSLLYPTWFFIQSALGEKSGGDARGVLHGTALWMPLFFLVIPYAVLRYWKVDVAETFRLRPPPARYVVAALLVGVSAWIPATQLVAVLKSLTGASAALAEQEQALAEALRTMPVWMILMIIAVIPGTCEELLFRGFLLSGLAGVARKWPAIIACGVIFGVFHYMLIRVPITAAIGVVLALLVWQSRSIWPAVLAHVLHNGLGCLISIDPTLQGALGITEEAMGADRLPARLVLIGTLIFTAGVLLAWWPVGRASPGSRSADALDVSKPAVAESS